MYTYQLQCYECGYHTPVSPDGIDLTSELYGDEWHSNWDAICTCHECKTLFHRLVVAGKTEDRCRFCGSENITIHDEEHPMVCPVCGQDTLQPDYTTVSHYF